MSFTSIVIAGGATKVAAVIGVIKYLEEKKSIKDIKHFVGTSAGSIMCLLLALGYNSQEIKKTLLETLEDKSVTEFDAENLFEMFSTYGINNGDNLEILFQKFIYKKYKTNSTFLELAKSTGRNLVVCVSNLSKEQSEYFSVDTTPDMSVAKAVRISCSIPIMFCPVMIKENIYLDGGLYNNFPIDYFKDNRLHDILGINIVCKNYQHNDNFFQYMQFILNSIVKKFNQKSITILDNNVITLEFDDDSNWFKFSELKINLSKETLEKYIKMGYDEAKLNLFKFT